MPIYVKDPETEEAVRSYAASHGLSVTAAIRQAVREARARDDAGKEARIEQKLSAIRELQERWACLPKLMSDEQVDAWMYDDDGLPH